MALKKMKFKVINRNDAMPPGEKIAYLIIDAWDDWGEFNTLYRLVIFDDVGEKYAIGELKIGEFSMSRGQRSPNLPESFPFLEDSFFSLGQDNSYYTNLYKLQSGIRNEILAKLNDVVADEELLERAMPERVTKISLLRSVSVSSIRGQFRRILDGQAILTTYAFTYTLPKQRGSDAAPIKLRFRVKPDTLPPSNIHVLIGRNGVGKTHILNKMALALKIEGKLPSVNGSFEFDEVINDEQFASVISISFSAFDPFQPLPEAKDKSQGVTYSYIGLKRQSNIGGKVGTPKTPEMLRREFVKSLRASLQGASRKRWLKVMSLFEDDPNFRDAQITTLDEVLDEELAEEEDSDFDTEAGSRFDALSTGHKLVALTLTKLVELVEERTLVLFDEPESHLHPPLLAQFIRALSELLTDRNGVAILATHSPVVLQEVPRTCAWVLARSGSLTSADRPEEETFGENVGVLTREIFGLEVMNSGFYKLITKAVSRSDSLESFMTEFNNKIGVEGRGIARALFSAKRKTEQ